MLKETLRTGRKGWVSIERCGQCAVQGHSSLVPVILEPMSSLVQGRSPLINLNIDGFAPCKSTCTVDHAYQIYGLA